jgi:hypothetical protein
MMQHEFFEPKRAAVLISPKSPAHRTLFWFLYGHDPEKIVMAVYGELEWCLPQPFLPTFFGSAVIHRAGSYLSN